MHEYLYFSNCGVFLFWAKQWIFEVRSIFKIQLILQILSKIFQIKLKEIDTQL